MSTLCYRNRAAQLALPPAVALLGNEPEGLGIDFLQSPPQMYSRSRSEPSKNLLGDINEWFTYTSPSTKYVRNSDGLYVPGTTLRCLHDPLGVPLGLLIERQSTGYVRQSANMNADNSPWSSVASFASVNPKLSVLQGQTAHEHVSSGSGGRPQTISGGLTENTDYRLIVIAERFANDPVGFGFGLAPVWRGLAAVTWSTNSIAQAGGTISNAQFSDLGIGPNGGRLCQASCVVNSGATGTYAMYVYPNGAGGVQTPSAGQSTIIHYAQIEPANITLGSPIVTGASQVTRASDVIELMTARFPYDATGYSMLMDGSFADIALNSYFARLTDSSSVSNLAGPYKSGAAQWQHMVRSGGNTQAQINAGASGSYSVRVATRTFPNDFAVSVLGGTVGTNVSGLMPTGIDRLRLHIGGGSGQQLLRGLVYTPRRWDDAELQARSTI